MTMDPDLDPLDELASAYLDDEVTPVQRAQVEADPELLARVGRLRPFVTALREPLELDDSERETAIAAALDAFTSDPVADSPAAPAVDPHHPDQLVAARRRRERRADRTRRIGVWLGAAAAAGAIGVVATGGFGSGSDLDSASTADTVGAAAADAPAETISEIAGGADVATEENATAAADGSESTAAAAADSAFSQVALAFTTEAELIDYVRNVVAARSSAATETVPAPSMAPPCGLPAGLDGDSVGSAAWMGAPGELFLVPSALEPTSAMILSVDCAQVLVRVDL